MLDLLDFGFISLKNTWFCSKNDGGLEFEFFSYGFGAKKAVKSKQARRLLVRAARPL